VLSLGELAAQVKHLPERHVGQVWVTGGITNLPAQSSGHDYSRREEAAARLSCVPRQGAI
jgi:exonuclease VII large subunit